MYKIRHLKWSKHENMFQKHSKLPNPYTTKKYPKHKKKAIKEKNMSPEHTYILSLM
jgi:hypothetical protein